MSDDKKKASKFSPKAAKGRKRHLSPVDTVKRDVAQIQADLARLSHGLVGLQENTLKNLQVVSETSGHNSRVLCDYVDDIADRLHGMVTVQMRHSEILAQMLESELGKEEGWAPRITEQMVVDAAQQRRDKRLEEYKTRHGDDALLDDNVVPMKPLDQMTDEELAKVTDKSSKSDPTEYPSGAQFFGGE